MITTITPFVVLALCATPWLVLVGRRFGHVIGALSVMVGIPLLVLVSFHVSLTLSTDPVWITLGSAGAAGAAGLVLLTRHRGVSSRPGRAAIATWLPACAGLVAWVATLMISPLVSGSIRGWAMNGDAGNNIRISRGMLENHGYPLTQLQAVPLPNELLSIAGWAGRGGTAGEVFAHDLYALASFGALAIGATGILIGVVASSLLPDHRVARIAIVGAIASLACATWFVSGLPIESGYFNVHVVLPFVLASWLAFLQSRRHPVAAAMVLVGLALVITASWAPVAIVPVGFGVALLLRHRHSPRLARGPIPLVMLGVVAIGGTIAVVSNLPALPSFLALLSSPGHGFPSTLPILTVTAAASIAAAVLAHRRALAEVRPAVIAFSVSVAAGLAILLSVNVHEVAPLLAYYPAKYTWIVTVAFEAVLVSLLVLHLDRLRARWAAIASAALVALSLAAATLGPAPQRANVEIEQPLARILTDSVWTEGERSVATIIEYTGQPQVIMQWATGSADEAFINFWALEFKGTAPDAGNSTARFFTVSSYRKLRDTGTFTTPGIARLCIVAATFDSRVTVHTRDAGLAEELQNECAEVSVDVIVDPPAGAE